MPSRTVGRLAPIALLALVAGIPGGPAPAAAQPLKSVGDERVIGKNRTGEECRLRLLDRRTDGFRADHQVAREPSNLYRQCYRAKHPRVRAPGRDPDGWHGHV